MSDQSRTINDVIAALPKTVTLAEAEVISGLSRPTLYREMDAGRLRYVKIGRSRHILVPSLKTLMGADE